MRISRNFRMMAGAAGLALMAATACAPTPTGGGGNTATVVVGGQSVEVSVPSGLTVTAAAADPATLPPAPDGLSFPFGSLDINVTNVTPGAVVHIVVAVPSPVSGFQKLIGGAWDPFAFDGTTGATVAADGMSVALDLQDGGRGDSDGVANGVIVDPGSPNTGIAVGCYPAGSYGLFGALYPAYYTGPMGGVGSYGNVKVYANGSNLCTETDLLANATVVTADSRTAALTACHAGPMSTANDAYQAMYAGPDTTNLGWNTMPRIIWVCVPPNSTYAMVPGRCYVVPPIAPGVGGFSFKLFGAKNTLFNVVQYLNSPDCTGATVQKTYIQQADKNSADRLCSSIGFSIDYTASVGPLPGLSSATYPSLAPNDVYVCVG